MNLKHWEIVSQIRRRREEKKENPEDKENFKNILQDASTCIYKNICDLHHPASG